MIDFIDYTDRTIKCEHTDRPTFCRGMCKKCHRRAETLSRNPTARTNKKEYQSPKSREGSASCHPNRQKYHSDGSCQSCYSKRLKYNVDFVAMYAEQNGNCKLCLTHFNEDELDVDHDHLTGEARGLVCTACNLVIAGAEHPMLALALAYLKKG